MQPFAYARTATVRSALEAMSQHPNSQAIAGGTSLLDLMKRGVAHPTLLVDLNGLSEGEILVQGEGLRIGALVRNSDLANHPTIRDRYPLLSEALLSGASPQLRHMATVGGNLLQRTRCAYFRDPSFACNKREPGTGCSALHGCHRGHAVLGTSEACIATHPSDMAVALVTLEAVVETQGPDGQRKIPIQEFYRLPGDTPHLETALFAGELITGLQIADFPAARRSCYLKVRDRAAFDFALASVAAILEVHEGRIQTVQLALGGIATVPWRAYQAEQVLQGQAPSAELFDRAADAELASAVPRGVNAYKVTLSKRLMIRALERLCLEVAP